MIPLFRPSCSDLEVEMVTQTLRSGWWGQGPVTEKLESEFTTRMGVGASIAVNSGTMALELAARSLSVDSKWTVIVPALTFISTAQAMLHTGAKVLFADVNRHSLVIDWDDVRDILSEIPVGVHVAVVPVWYGGYVDTIPEDILDRCVVIEDCAHAAGSEKAGQQGDVAAWSFHAVKNLAAGDGGMITFKYRGTYGLTRALRWCGIDRSTWERDSARGYGWDYNIIADGEKAHMNDITASVALAQLRRLTELKAARYQRARRYQAELSRKHLELPSVSPFRSNHLFVVRVPGELRGRFIGHMLDNGVSAGVHYKPLHLYDKLTAGDGRLLPVTDRVWKTLVTLPLYPDMTEDEQTQVIEAVGSFRK